MKSMKQTEDDRVVLSLDGHVTHTEGIALLERARETHPAALHLYTSIYTLLRLCTLDVSFMISLSTYHAQEIETWLRQNPGEVVTIQVGCLFVKPI